MPRAIAISPFGGAVLLLALSAAAPVAVAECFPEPHAGTHVERPYVFTATVRELVTEPDLRSLGAGEVPGVLWQATLDVRRVYGGDVPDTLELKGSTSTIGIGGGCSWFLGDRVETGDVVLVAVDDIIPFATNRSLFGHLLLWRRVGAEWRFYERALQDGGEPDAYPEAARRADTTADILKLVRRLGIPDTATTQGSAPSVPSSAWGLLLISAGLGVAALHVRTGRRRVRGWR